MATAGPIDLVNPAEARADDADGMAMTVSTVESAKCCVWARL
jgi:hypothetical protein